MEWKGGCGCSYRSNFLLSLFYWIVPPTKPIIHDANGRKMTSTLGPYKVGEDLIATCLTSAGEYGALSCMLSNFFVTNVPFRASLPLYFFTTGISTTRAYKNSFHFFVSLAPRWMWALVFWQPEFQARDFLLCLHAWEIQCSTFPFNTDQCARSSSPSE